ncbi:MAG: nucleotidyltransferase domain-containing protein [Candidatus Woesearchaeota archaeon]|nr:nucleotidyltransferase domain-containing protein [Candidatus Woesearchaeota archaeon]
MKNSDIFRPSILNLKIVRNLSINKEGLTIKNLSNNLQKDYKNIHDAVNQLFKIGIIKKEKIGNYNICKLNYSNDELIEYLKEYNYYIALGEFRKKHSIEHNIIMEAIRQIIAENYINHIFVCLVFGSYSKGEEKKDSDLDILFITTHKRITSISCKEFLDEKNAPYQRRFHVIEQSVTDFMKDLKNKTKLSIAIELFNEPPVVLYGDDIFFRLIVEFSKLW